MVRRPCEITQMHASHAFERRSPLSTYPLIYKFIPCAMFTSHLVSLELRVLVYDVKSKKINNGTFLQLRINNFFPIKLAVKLHEGNLLYKFRVGKFILLTQ